MTRRSAQAPSQSDEQPEVRRGLAIVLAAVLAYCVIHAGFRLIASSSLGEDDPLESILVQNLHLGYMAPQPPLYDWVLYAVQKLTGPGVAGFLLIKYAALTATAVLLYLSAVRVLRDWLWAALTVECMALIYQIAWRYHEGFTHEVGAMVAVAATLWAWLRILQRGRIVDFVVLGLLAGLGAMTEVTYWAFLASLTAASLLQPAARARILRWPLVLGAVIALAVASPYVYWIATYAGPITWLHPWSASVVKNLGKGLLDALRGPLFYLSPLIVIVPIVFPGALATAHADVRRPPSRGDEADLPQIILHSALAGMVLCLAGALLLGLAGYAMHRLMPLYLPAVIWLMSVAQRASGAETRPRTRFARLALAIAAIALVARLANMFVLDPVCKICRWGVPYEGLAQAIAAAGFSGGSIVSVDVELAGNLRAKFPHAAVSLPDGRGAPPAKGPSLALVWPGRMAPGDASRRLGHLLPPGHTISEARLVTVPWHHVWRPTGYRSSQWHVLVVKSIPN